MRTRKGRKVEKTTKESKYHWAVDGKKHIVFKEMREAFAKNPALDVKSTVSTNHMLDLMNKHISGRRC